MNFDIDQDALHAAANLVGRTGAKNLTVGYLNEDDVPVAERDWYAQAQYQGAKIIVEHHVGPVEALDALAHRLLAGAKCKCGRLVALDDDAAFAFFRATTVDGARWDAEAAAAAGQCRWQRLPVAPGGRTEWVSGCDKRARDASGDVADNRAERRAAAKKARKKSPGTS